MGGNIDMDDVISYADTWTPPDTLDEIVNILAEFVDQDVSSFVPCHDAKVSPPR